MVLGTRRNRVWFCNRARKFLHSAVADAGPVQAAKLVVDTWKTRGDRGPEFVVSSVTKKINKDIMFKIIPCADKEMGADLGSSWSAEEITFFFCFFFKPPDDGELSTLSEFRA
jgi:hypothetical protein